MAKTDLEQLVVSLEANIKQYERELARANQVTVRELRNIERSADKSVGYVEKRMSGLGISLRAGFAGAAAAVAVAFAAVAKSAISDAAAIGDLSDKIGLSTDKLQGLSYGAVQANVGFEDLSGGLLKFSKNIGEAANHSGELYKILQLNGVAVADAAGKQRPYNDLLNDFADLVKNAKSEQEALALITAAFGKGSDGFLEFLSKGSAGLKDFQKDASDAGAKIDDALIRKAQILDDRWAALMLSMKSNTQSAVLSIIDALGSIPELGNGRQLKGFGDLDSFVRESGSRISGDTRPGGPSQFATYPAIKSGGVPPPKKFTVLPDPEADARAAAAAKAAEQAAKDAERDRKRLADEAARAAAEKAKAISDVISALTLEEAQLGRSNVQQRIANELKAAGTTADTAAGQAIIAKVQSIALETQAMEDAAITAEQLAEKQQAFYEGLTYLAETGVNAFDALIVQGQDLDDVLKGVIKQLASAALQATLLGQGPLAGLFGTQSSSGGLGGFFGSLLGGFKPASASIYHSGGIAGMGGLTRNVDPSIFSGAPRYHSGGIAGLTPGEIPAILQKGERIIPRGGSQSNGNKSTIINIDARNADAGQIAQLRAELRNMNSTLHKTIRNVVLGEKSNNPSFAR